MMAKMTVSLTKMAEQAGLDMDVSVSVDMTETRFRFSGPGVEKTEFTSGPEAITWLDGYSRGMARAPERRPVC